MKESGRNSSLKFDMYRFNPWLFGMLFFFGSIYLLYTNFQAPEFLMGETNTTEGLILDFDFAGSYAGRGEVQRANILFSVEDTFYLEKKRLDAKYGVRPIGSTLSVLYSIADPTDFRVKGYYQLDFTQNQVKFGSADTIGFKSLLFRNGILKSYREDTDNHAYDEEYYFYSMETDTIDCVPILSDGPQKRFLQQVVSDDLVHLMDMQDSTLYR